MTLVDAYPLNPSMHTSVNPSPNPPPFPSSQHHPAQQSMAATGPMTELDKLWALLGELSAQLSHNRQQTEVLHQRAEELKTQAVHTQTGFTLKRFNIDVSKEEFESELERLNVSLVLENQALQQENRQCSVLLKDYESTLETVMAKFRAYAHATQQHHLDLTRHYENLLLSMPSNPAFTDAGMAAMPNGTTAGDQEGSSPGGTSSSSAGAGPLASSAAGLGTIIDPLHLQLSLAHLGSLVRKAMRSLQGEDPEDSTSPSLEPIGGLGPLAGLFNNGGVGAGYDDDEAARSSSPTPSSASSSSSLSMSGPSPVPRTRARDRDVSTGGYIGRSATTNPHYIPTTSTSSLVSSPPRSRPATTAAAAASAGLSSYNGSSSSGHHLTTPTTSNDSSNTTANASSGVSASNTLPNGTTTGTTDTTTDSSSSSAGGPVQNNALALSVPPPSPTQPQPQPPSSPSQEELLERLLRGPVDEPLEREIELETLRRENEHLRRLLCISEEEVWGRDHQQERERERDSGRPGTGLGAVETGLLGFGDRRGMGQVGRNEGGGGGGGGEE